MTNYLGLVFSFMVKHKQPIARYPAIPESAVCDLALRLIQEEVRELEIAIEKEDIYLIADALADLKYVTFWADLAFGIPADSIFEAVQVSNMSKSVDENRGRDKKVDKGIMFRPPNIRPIIDACIKLGKGDY